MFLKVNTVYMYVVKGEEEEEKSAGIEKKRQMTNGIGLVNTTYMYK